MSATPCKKLEKEVVQVGEKNYQLKLEMVDSNNSKNCVQQAVVFKYKGTFTAEKPFELEIFHGKDSVKNFVHPELVRKRSRTDLEEKESKGPIMSLIDWFTGLFHDEPKVISDSDVKVDTRTFKEGI